MNDESHKSLCDLLVRWGDNEAGIADTLSLWLRNYVSAAVKRALNNSPEVEDAIQEITIKCYRQEILAALFRMQDSRPCSFLAVVVAHAIRDIIRRNSRRLSREIVLPPEDLSRFKSVDQTDDPRQRLMKNEQTQTIRSVLQSLTKDDRRILMLHFGFYGSPQSYAAISEKLGLNKEATKKRAQRALQLLRSRAPSFVRNSEFP